MVSRWASSLVRITYRRGKHAGLALAALPHVAPLYPHLSVTDPDTVAALFEAADGRDRQELALTALHIGILSLKAARGTVDGAAIRHEGERLLGTLAERLDKHRLLLDEQLGGALRTYFDPASGAFSERVQRLVRADGELAMVIGSQVDAARRSLDELLAQHLGESSPLRALLSPDESNAFIATLRAQVTQASVSLGGNVSWMNLKGMLEPRSSTGSQISSASAHRFERRSRVAGRWGQLALPPTVC